MSHNSIISIVALISGRGSNLKAILDAIRNDALPVSVRAVISNRPNAPGLEYAHLAGIETAVVDHKAYTKRDEFDVVLRSQIDHYQPDLVVLAGFMRILGSAFVSHYAGRLLNIHPSLLPKFTGLNTHARAIAAAEQEQGASVHFVTSELDGGAVVCQARVAIVPNDDPDRLAARVLVQEHKLYPQVLRWFAEGRIQWQSNNTILFDGKALSAPLQLEELS